MPLIAKFAAVFAIIGLVISLAFGFLGGNRLLPLLLTALVCTLISAALGAGVYQILELRVPEFLDLFRGDYLAEGEAGGSYDLDAMEEGVSLGEDSDMTAEMPEEDAEPATSGESKVFGDHIMVGDIQIKNEPKIMAAAIRTLLAKDDS